LKRAPLQARAIALPRRRPLFWVLAAPTALFSVMVAGAVVSIIVAVFS
jgi:hypothetical protein